VGRGPVPVGRGEPAVKQGVGDRGGSACPRIRGADGPGRDWRHVGGRAADGEPADAAGLPGGQPQPGHAAKRQADEVDAPDAETIHRLQEVVDRVVDAIGAWRDG
jgi:hypothetical protein